MGTIQQQEERLRIAIQKSGRLQEDSIDLLKQCGIKLLKSKDQLFCRAQDFPLDVYFVRDDDIPAFVSSNTCDIGIVGQNVLVEEQLTRNDDDIKSIQQIFELGFGKCRLSLAVPYDFEYGDINALDKKSIATSYPGILKDYLSKKNISAKIIEMSGSVEIAPRINMAVAICDLVSTGSTLTSNGLEEVEVMMESQAVLIEGVNTSAAKKEILSRLLTRIKGVNEARASKYIMLHAPKDSVAKIQSVLPGAESPTILDIQGRDDMVAIHAVCNEGVFWNTMEELQAKGASSVLVLPIEKMLG